MKKIFKYIFAGFVGCASLSSCLDDALQTAPTDSMSGDGLLANANAALVPLNGIYRSMYASWSPTGNTHQSFGISSYNLMADVMGEDMIMSAIGSGWFWYDCLYNVKSFYSSGAWRSYDLWNGYYTWVSNANYILAAEETMDGTTEEINYVIGQAYAIRAYSYFMLAQSFARTYKGHESDQCCPIYTEPTVAGTAGKARATVQEVYDQITSDINKAVDMLNGIKRKHVSHINHAVALGLKARIALVMEDWATAKSAAKNAITVSGCTVLPVSSFSGLNDSSVGNVMWGAEIISDQSTVYAGFFTHMDACDERGDGKYGADARKQISKELYGLINPADARKAWWDQENENNKSGGYQQEKFKFSDRQTWTGDYIWMRVEEMYLIKAEGEAMSGNLTKAKQTLEDFVKTYRNPSYACTASSAQEMQDEIWLQRRMELWGEGFALFDILRLKKPIIRKNTNYEAIVQFNLEPESQIMIYRIPQCEMETNKGIKEEDNNPAAPQPTV